MAGIAFTILGVSAGFCVSAAPDCVRGVHRGRIAGATPARVRRWLQPLAPLRGVSVVSLSIPTATKFACSVGGGRWDRNNASSSQSGHAGPAFGGRASAILALRQCSCRACQVDGCARYPIAVTGRTQRVNRCEPQRFTWFTRPRPRSTAPRAHRNDAKTQDDQRIPPLPRPQRR